MNESLPIAISQTHLHLLAVINSEIRRRGFNNRSISILDAGCGNGALMSYLQQAVVVLNPSLDCKVYGFDVLDHGVQENGFLEVAKRNLGDDLPDIPWHERVRAIASNEPWPFDVGNFDFVVSNQVLEHVLNPVLFFQEAKRVLVKDGIMVNIFPLRHYVFEGHLYLPFVHRIASSDLMRGYIALLSRLGLGKYKGHRSAFGVSVDRYSERHADYMQFYTNYLSESEVYDVVKRVGMRAAFRYSKERYTGKLRAILKMPPKLLYFTGDRGLSDSIAVKVLRYVSGVTFVCENSESYRN